MHARLCKVAPVRCVGCGVDQTFKKRSEYRKHLQEQCQNARFDCLACYQQLRRIDQVDHDCLVSTLEREEILRKKYEALSLRLEEKENVIFQLTENVQNQNQQIENLTKENSDFKMTLESRNAEIEQIKKQLQDQQNKLEQQRQIIDLQIENEKLNNSLQTESQG